MVVFYKKFIAFSYFFIVSFCINIHDCFSAPTAEEKRCAPGCFCVNNGNMPKYLGTDNICGASVAHPISCSRDRKNNIGIGMDEKGKWTGEVIACSRDTISPKVTYFFDDFSELYVGATGLYGFINGKLITMLSIHPESYAWGKAGVYTCPSSYPASGEGAKSVDECYKYDKKGNKVYYSEKRKNNKSKSHDLDAIDVQTINTLTDDLQDLLNQVNKIAS